MNKILTDAIISVAKGTSKKMLGKLLQSIAGENKGQIIPYRVEGGKKIICFVHGFCGDPHETFNPMPDFIVKENELLDWDVISIGYSTDLMPNIGKGIWASNPDINKVAGYLKTNLEIFFDEYDHVALIGHSMGGLIIQRTILNMTNTDKISHVLLYGTPSAGLRKAWFFRWFKNTISDMDHKGGFITKLREDWNTKFKPEYPFYFRAVAGEMDEFVPILSSLEPFPEQYRNYTSGNHITMVKPKNIMDTSFLIIKKALKPATTVFPKDDNYIDFNDKVAEYNSVVNSLKDKLRLLDVRGLRSYIFALEGIGRLNEAIEILESSNELKINTDLMGILGGRYKRKYLLEQEAESLNKALAWYKKALDISISKDNHQQIYYHSINIAFLQLMNDDQDLSSVKEMAKLALVNCEKANNGDYWEIATKAEASLYLNDFDSCQRFYTEAIVKANYSIRETSSMMINAIYACNSLSKLDWKKRLEEIFIEKA